MSLHKPLQTGTRVCKMCKTEKHITEFWVNRTSRGGRASRCKDCMRKAWKVERTCPCGNVFTTQRNSSAKYCAACRKHRWGSGKKKVDDPDRPWGELDDLLLFRLAHVRKWDPKRISRETNRTEEQVKEIIERMNDKGVRLMALSEFTASRNYISINL